MLLSENGSDFLGGKVKLYGCISPHSQNKSLDKLF